MEITVTVKLQIIVSAEDALVLRDTLDAYTFACNDVSAYVFSSKTLSPYALQEKLYYPLRSKYGLKSQMTQSVFKTVVAKYKTCKSNGQIPRKIAFTKPQIDLVWNRDYSLKGDTFSVNTLQGRKKFKFYAKGMEEHFSSKGTSQRMSA